MLERGEVANSWRRERWDSLRLLTPNWQSRLPGYRYDGPDPDGYMTMGEVIEFISRFATVSRRAGAHADDRHVGDAHRRRVSRGDEQRRHRCRCVVIASGACNCRACRRCRHSVPASIEQFTPFDYRNPAQLPDGGVLVVGASATGVQLAAEIHRSGRPVTLSVGEHVRLPRTYRGRDVLWWMDASGVWNQRYDEIDDLTRARRLPSPQLVGTPERTTLDLNALTAIGVELVGRLSDVRDGRALFSGGLRNPVRARRSQDGASARHVRRLGARAHPRRRRRRAGALRADARAAESSRLQIDLRSGEIRSIVWATGFRPDYSWLHVPVLDEKGHLRHDGGVVERQGCTRSACRCCGGASRASSTASRTMRGSLIDHLAGYLIKRAEV